MRSDSCLSTNRNRALIYPEQIYDKTDLIRWHLEPQALDFHAEILKKLKRVEQCFYSDWDTLAGLTAEVPVIQPSLFIFHTSRCGSTLMARLLALGQTNRVFMEPGALMSARSFLGRGLERRVGTLTTAYGLWPQDREKRLIFKLSSLWLHHVEILQQLFPGVPCWLMIRHPMEVLVSNVEKPPSYMRGARQPSWASSIGMPADVLVGQEAIQQAGLILENIYATARRNLSHFERVIDYADLPQGAFEDSARSWLDGGQDTAERMETVMKADAKNPAQKGEIDSVAKQNRATPEMKRLVEERLMEHYEALRKITLSS